MKTKPEKLASIAQWDAVLARYPETSSTSLLIQLAFALGANAVTLRLLVTGRMRPVDLVLLVAIEAVLLTAVAWMQSLRVPASARMEGSGSSLGQKLGIIAFGLFWLAVIYGLILGDSVEELARETGWPSVETLRQSGLQWPLSLCLLGAFVDVFRDWDYWTDRGGYFLSTPGFNATTRWLTLFLGAIPFLIPVVIVGKLIVTLFERRGSRSGDSPNMAVAALLVVGVFGVMLWLLNSGVSGWAVASAPPRW